MLSHRAVSAEAAVVTPLPATQPCPDLNATTPSQCLQTGPQPAQLTGARHRDLLRKIQKTKTTRNSSPEVPLPLPMLLVTPAAKLSASNASSPSSEDATSSGKGMPV